MAQLAIADLTAPGEQPLRVAVRNASRSVGANGLAA